MENALGFGSFIAGSKASNSSAPSKTVTPSQQAAVTDTPVLFSPSVPPPPHHVPARSAQSNSLRAEALMTREEHWADIDDALQSSDLYQWCCRQGGLLWKPIKWDTREKESSLCDVKGKSFLIAGIQVRPKGGYFSTSIDSLTAFLHDREPAVAHCQELQTPWCCVAQFKKGITHANKGYAVYTNVAKGYDTVA
eukprot:626245-Rhodomonas_salina.1